MFFSVSYSLSDFFIWLLFLSELTFYSALGMLEISKEWYSTGIGIGTDAV